MISSHPSERFSLRGVKKSAIIFPRRLAPDSSIHRRRLLASLREMPVAGNLFRAPQRGRTTPAKSVEPPPTAIVNSPELHTAVIAFPYNPAGKKEVFMEKINLGSVIEQAITRVEQNRIGEKPPVFVTLSPALTQVPWKDTALKQFLRFSL